MGQSGYSHRLGDGRLQCDLCPRLCKLRDGEHGQCLVRARAGRRVVLTSFGYASATSVDPVERLPLYHFQPGTGALSFGTAGCNLLCRFCPHWDTEGTGDVVAVAEDASPEAIVDTALRFGCRSVAFAYNDPVVFHEYALEVARACRARGLSTLALTAGYVCPRPRVEFYRHLDAATVDLKSLSRRFYRRLCGGHLQPVLDTLSYIRHETRVWLEITCMLIPGENDSDADLARLARWVAVELGPDVPVHFTGFRPAFRMLDTPPTPRSTLARARAIAFDCGLRYAYTGSADDPVGGTTSCHRCGRTLVERQGYEVTAWNLVDGRCALCRTACAGVFEAEPGGWGARRQAVRVAACAGA